MTGNSEYRPKLWVPGDWNAFFGLGTNVLLKWPASPGGFDLQTSTNLAPPMDWTDHFSVPVIVGRQIAFDNGATTLWLMR